MKKEDVQKYEYCRSYLADLALLKQKSPFKIQHFGCGSGVPAIEHTLETIHRNMYHLIDSSIDNAEKEVQKIIEGI